MSYSSGALLALHAAAAGLSVPRMVLMEPPIGDDETPETGSTFTAEVTSLIAEGRPGDAVEHFNTSIGVPAEMLAEMRETRAWSAMEAIARTLVYDSVLGDASPPELLASVTVPTLVIDSEGSSDDLTG